MESPLSNITDNWLLHPQGTLHQLRAETLNHVLPLADCHGITVYTNCSADQATGASGAAFFCDGVTRQWQVSDEASSLQTELVAIKND